jgi:hypothetical protein
MRSSLESFSCVFRAALPNGSRVIAAAMFGLGRTSAADAHSRKKSRRVSLGCGGILLAALLPQATSNYERIDTSLLPPLLVLPSGVDVVVAQVER